MKTNTPLTNYLDSHITSIVRHLVSITLPNMAVDQLVPGVSRITRSMRLRDERLRAAELHSTGQIMEDCRYPNGTVNQSEEMVRRDAVEHYFDHVREELRAEDLVPPPSDDEYGYEADGFESDGTLEDDMDILEREVQALRERLGRDFKRLGTC